MVEELRKQWYCTKKLRDHPFELAVALMSILPPLLVILDRFRADTNTVMARLSIEFPFDIAWAFICVLGGVLVARGVIRNTILPAIIGLRLTALGWVVYLLMILSARPRPSALILVAAGVCILSVSVMHSHRLSRKYKAMRQALHYRG